MVNFVKRRVTVSKKKSIMGNAMKALFTILVISVLLYCPILLRDPERTYKQSQIDSNPQNPSYEGVYVRNGLIPTSVYDWTVINSHGENGENLSHFEYDCFIWPLEKYRILDPYQWHGTMLWVNGNLESGIVNVETANRSCEGYARPLFSVTPITDGPQGILFTP